MMAPRSATRGAALPLALRSQAKRALGIPCVTSSGGTSTSISTESVVETTPRRSRTQSSRSRSGCSPGATHRAAASASRLRTGQPAAAELASEPDAHGSNAASTSPSPRSLEWNASPTAARSSRSHFTSALAPAAARRKPQVNAAGATISCCAAPSPAAHAPRHASTAAQSPSQRAPSPSSAASGAAAASSAGRSSAKHG
mmetsp:Transcript_16005/g.49760  ORF Transcript_16005/g.49760 Transcript_16005/m.49760 type:complete len:200 (-) Transcript_16005:454-1053(-)